MSDHRHVENLDDLPLEADASDKFDHLLVDQIKAQALIDAGFTGKDEDGALRANQKLLPGAVLQTMQNNHVANGKRELAARAVTKFELYAELLPDGPGVRRLANSAEESAAQDELMKYLWGLTNTGTSGFVQKSIGELGLVLCEASVSRTKINEETGKREPRTEPGRFITASRDLIMTYFTAPAGAAFLRAARKLEAQLGLVSTRRPELAAPVARQLGVVVRQAVGAIPHADVKQVAALTADDNQSDIIDG
ncbi:hypothetical protein [Dactylosporangium sp. CS-033363]|uniref:hypothetical protein n=1 Tax=Dactylosporangium sp. CS-033363 TaxID=3239935 RepID=UPI003D8B93AE